MKQGVVLRSWLKPGHSCCSKVRYSLPESFLRRAPKRFSSGNTSNAADPKELSSIAKKCYQIAQGGRLHVISSSSLPHILSINLTSHWQDHCEVDLHRSALPDDVKLSIQENIADQSLTIQVDYHPGRLTDCNVLIDEENAKMQKSGENLSLQVRIPENFNVQVTAAKLNMNIINKVSRIEL